MWVGLGRIGPNGVIRVVVWTGLDYKGWGFLWVKFISEKGCLFVAYISPRTKCVKTENSWTIPAIFQNLPIRTILAMLH